MTDFTALANSFDSLALAFQQAATALRASTQPTPIPQVPGLPPPPSGTSPVNSVPTNRAQQYAKDFLNAALDSTRHDEINGICLQIETNSTRYQTVASSIQCTYWPLIGMIHSLEADFNFTKSISDGDSPLTGTWEQDATSVFTSEGWSTWRQWDIVGCLFRGESYNGEGYYNLGVTSPYLWAGTDLYIKGKYTRPHYYDPNAVSKQIGVGTLLKYLLQVHGL